MALHRGQRHGYALIGDVAALTDGAIRLGPGTLYRSLQRMRVEGWIDELDTAPAADAAGPDAHGDHEPVGDRRAERRRSYRLTRAGRAAARAEAERLRRLVDAAAEVGLLSELADPSERTEPSAPIEDDHP